MRAGPRALRLPLLLAALLSLIPFASPPSASAHPLGNFTINHFSRLGFSEGEARVYWVLDYAEVPTLREDRKPGLNGDGKLSPQEAEVWLDRELPGLVRDLRLEANGEALPLRVVERSAEYARGQAGLPTMRVEAELAAPLPERWEGARVTYEDRTYADQLGWREIVAAGGIGVALEDSSAPATGVSRELRAYPEDSLQSPLDVRSASLTLVRGAGGGASDTAGRAAEQVQQGERGGGATDRVASLLSADALTPGAILLALLAALFWGAAHALTPGHGKTVVAAYLVGARGTAKHAVFLGLTVTLTHTLGVFALGAVTLLLSSYILPEELYPWLSVASGLLVVLIGGTLLVRRLRAALSPTGAGHAHAHEHQHDDGRPHDHPHWEGCSPDLAPEAVGAQPRAGGALAYASGEHGHGASHDHYRADGPGGHEHSHGGLVHSHDGHTHSHLPPGGDGSRVTWRSLLALGVSGGLVPCPSALVLLLGAISLGRLGFGMVLVVAFSLGLAGVLTGIGLLLVYARRIFERHSFQARAPRFLPVASAVAIVIAGLAIVVSALQQTGLA